jgi:hypothetical protein
MKPETKLIDLIKVYDDVLPVSKCKEIIDLFESSEEHWDKQRTEVYLFDQVNANKTPGWEPVRDLVAELSIQVFNHYFKDIGMKTFPPVKALEEIRIKKYENSDRYFDYHIDVSDYKSARRYLVGFIYLDDNEGGHTVFPDLGLWIPPKAGRMLVFPPLWMYPHAGMPPIDKPKYIIGTYAHFV